MTLNSNDPREALTPGDREDQQAGGSRSVVTVPQPSDTAHQGDPLPIARPVPVQTSGRLEFAARCPNCRDWHRHVGLGERRAPCGVIYLLEFATKAKGAA
jgi:hypothetical protein